MYIKTFSEIFKNDTAITGGKGASLGEMYNSGIPVPVGFVVTTEAFEQFSEGEIPVEVREEILQAFDKLGADRVAVRSSAVAEDSSGASWAGQLESYLNVDRNELIEKIRECWNSIKSERALSYAGEQNLSEEDLSVAVVVQKMVDSEVSGVMFTVNPVTGDRDEVMIEACWGLGEMLVQGIITPDNYIITITSGEVTSDIQTQETMLVFEDGQNQEIAVPEDKKSQEKLSEEQIKELAKLGKKIEDHYGFPVDIEWAMEKDKFYIVQSRPITTLKIPS